MVMKLLLGCEGFLVFLPGFNTFITSEVVFVNSFCSAAVFFASSGYTKSLFSCLYLEATNVLHLVHFTATSE